MMVWLGICVPSVVLKMLLRSDRWMPRGWYLVCIMSDCPWIWLVFGLCFSGDAVVCGAEVVFDVLPVPAASN